MSEWSGLLQTAPLVAIVLALATTVVYIFRARERLQQKYNEDMVKAMSALQELTAEYLKQAFTDSKAWQERFTTLEAQLGGLKEKADRGDAILQDLHEISTWLKDVHDKPDGKGGYIWWGSIAVGDGSRRRAVRSRR